ncbi:MAG TPA: hypothetical protein VGQ86_05355 [Candidatus Limnocylindria bacterium]|nr:hypothetical protein [Candidatus Limnocylindria bacterium]
MSAGQGYRRQTYSFAHASTPVRPVMHQSSRHHLRVALAAVTAIAVDIATFATISMLIPGR